jgi:diguanylate cyclase (GGDEF)-like protein
MTAKEAVAESHLTEHRKSFVSLRWLLVILGSYLTLFPRIGAPTFLWVFVFVLAFAMTNVVCAWIRRDLFGTPQVQRAINVADVVFVAATFFLLRSQGTYLHFAFIAVFILAVVWRELKILVFSIFVVSVLYGAFTAIRAIQLDVDAASFLSEIAQSTGDVEQFLTLALFFLVSVFYLFLSDRLKRDAQLSAIILEEKHRAEVMADITRSLSEILYLIATRLCEVTGAAECSIVRMDPKAKNAEIVVKSAEPHVRNTAIDIEKFPEMVKAHQSQDVLFMPDVDRDRIRQSVIAVPMLVQDVVMGLIHIKFDGARQTMSESDMRFLKVMAGTAANALRNAQLFEEMEHRARTDFLTGLPNHRFFQTQLSMEFGRAQRHNHPLSLLVIDLDFLKKVNDRFGHPSGDGVIRGVADCIRSTCREFDFAARYGGEEFTVILPETPLAGAIQAADRLRERISDLDFSGIGSVTASIGVSNYPVNALNKEDIIRVADQALYVAKNGGRDRVAYFSYQLITR